MSHALVPSTIPFHLYEGFGVTPDVPDRWPASLNGRPLPIDTSDEQWGHRSMELLRQQADSSDKPAEASLNPQGPWRRAQESWHRGAGQSFLDRPQADQFRFRSSKGIDPWTYYELGLLPATDQKRTSANTRLFIVPAGDRLYITDGATAAANLLYTTSITGDTPSFTAVTGTPANSAQGIASDGFNVYIAYGANGIYKTDNNAAAAASYVTGTIDSVAYVKARLMCSSTNSIYNIVAAGALPTALLTQANTDFAWVGFAEGRTHIFAAGFSGDKSLIYSITIKDDATALDAPTVAGELPDGEVIHSIGSYLGFIVLGTSRGWRFCEDDNGVLTIGTTVETPNIVHCFEGQERFIWFGYTNYDATSTGLGRMDLTQFTESIETGARTPAYASDLMATGQGAVRSIATFQNRRVFSVDGLGFYAEETTAVDTGTLDTGYITFGLPDQKTAMFVDVRTKPLDGSYSVYLATDEEAFATVGQQNTPNDTGEEFPCGQARGEKYELRFVLNSESTPGPILTRWTLKATPGSLGSPAEYIIAPFLLHQVVDVLGREEFIDVKRERDAIKGLYQSQQPVIYQESENIYNVQVSGYQWVPYNYSTNTRGFGTPDGTMVTLMKRVY